MKNSPRVPDIILIIVLSCFFQFVNAQIVYTDVIPDQINSCSSTCGNGTSCLDTFSIDINQDGQDDFTLTTASAGGITHPIYVPCSASVRITGLDGNDVSCTNGTQPIQYSSGSSIFGATWSWGVLRSVFAGNFSGQWSEPGDKYLFVRLLIDSNFYYGWVRLNISVTEGVTAQCTVKDFAYNSVPNSSILAGQSSITGIATPETENYFSAFPNPAYDKITLSFSSPEKKEIQITNTLGQIVFAKEINSAKADIDVSEFPAGMYVVSAQTATQKMEKKFLKQ